MLKKQYRLFIASLHFFVLSQFALSAQDIAGADKMFCGLSNIQIGAPQPACSGCCWKWEPSTGLSSNSVAQPAVSSLATTTEYTVTKSLPDGSAITDKVVVYVFKVDIDLFKPRFIDGTEPQLDEMEEESRGVQTFVNLDSDDLDSDFDLDDSEISGGDDEFIKTRITLEILSDPGSTIPALPSVVRIQGTGEVSSIRLWKSADKSAGEYILGQDFALEPVTDHTYSGDVWIEGIAPHTNQRAVQLFAECSSTSAEGTCTSGSGSITVLGIDHFNWIAMHNGYTGGDGKNNADGVELDAHTSENGYPDHRRVFPEAKFSGTAPALTSEDKVKLQITLTTAPIEPIPVYLRLLDLDDPSSDFYYLDPNDDVAGTSGLYSGSSLTYEEEQDNRGEVNGYKCGKLLTSADLTAINTADGIYKNMTAADVFSVVLRVSPYPGDNYGVQAYGDREFVERIRNWDKFDKEKIVFESIVCATDDCPAIDSRLVSEPLTVWRTLHIEYDQMNNPTWEDNMIIRGYFSDFVSYSGSTSIKQVETISGIRAPKPASAGGAWIWDETKPLIDGSGAYPKGTGRFNDGGVRVGNPPTVICDKGGCIKHNTVDAVTFYGPNDLTLGGLTAVLSTPGGSSPPLPILDIEKLTGQDFKVTVDIGAASINLADYEGGGVNISNAGPCTVCVETVSGAPTQFILKNSAGKSNLKIPIVLTDDDAIPWGGVSTLIQPLTFSVTKDIFAQAYIDAVNDGGGRLSNNGFINFSRNTNRERFRGAEIYSLSPLSNYTDYANSGKYENHNFWIVNVVSGWQPTTSEDGDPKSELSVFARTIAASSIDDCNLSVGGNTSMIFHETIIDGNIVNALEITTAHEIGHQFGLTHGNGDGTKCADCVKNFCLILGMGVMIQGYPKLPGPYFIPPHKNLIRCRYYAPDSFLKK